MQAPTNTTGTIITSILDAITTEKTIVTTLSERERIRMEFYQTYDPMTGIRIAVTLGGFFTLMVILVVYKSKCKSQEDVELEAAISAVVIAEEEELEEELSNGQLYAAGGVHVQGSRYSYGNISGPPYTRFSSVGGHDHFMNPPIRNYRFGGRGRASLPSSDIAFQHFTTAPTPSTSDLEVTPRICRSYDEEEEDELEEAEQRELTRQYLQVPSYCRRVSNTTISSSDTSYLENRGSCMQVGNPPVIPDKDQSSSWDFYYPIDIQVIQPTPQISPTCSTTKLNVNNHLFQITDECRCSFEDTNETKTLTAPLASLGSCSVTSSVGSSEMKSLECDSVFTKSGTDDTDFDTNLDGLSIGSEQNCQNRKYRIVSKEEIDLTKDQNFKRLGRRHSDSNAFLQSLRGKPNLSAIHSLPEFISTVGTLQMENKDSFTLSDSSSTTISTTSSCSSVEGRKCTFSCIAIVQLSPDQSAKLINKTEQLTSSKSYDHLHQSIELPSKSTGSLGSLKIPFTQETLF